MARNKLGLTGGFEQEADIVVQMLGLGAAGGNYVDVDIKDCLGNRTDALQTRLLPRFPQRDAQDVGIAIGVPAGLQPLVQLPVMGQEGMAPTCIHDPGGTGDMAHAERSFEAIGMLRDEAEHALQHRRFAIVDWAISPQLLEQRLAMHPP